MAHRLTPQAMLLLYKCYVRPVVEYSVVVWSFRLRSSELTELDRVQARFARSYLRKRKIRIDFSTSKQDLNKKANIERFESLLYRRQFISLGTMHKFIFKYRRCLASFHFNITQSARRPNKIILPKAKTTSKSLFLFQTSLLWNCLPPRLIAEPSIIVFKNELRKLTCKHSASLSGMPTPCTYPPVCSPTHSRCTTFTFRYFHFSSYVYMYILQSGEPLDRRQASGSS